jgi:hypothetical protein
MPTIPSGQAARDAWAALHPEAREAIVRRARRYEAPTDPALAAIVLGRLRSGADLQWYRDAAVVAGAAVGGGALVAWLGEQGGRDLLGLGSLTAIGFLVAGAAMNLPEEYALRRTEASNLTVFLASPDAAASPASARQIPWLRATLTTAALVLGIPAVAAVLVQRLDIAFRWPTLGRTALLVAAVGLASNVVTLAVRRWDPRRDRAHRVRAGDDGVRFGVRRPIPWSDVLGVELTGPTAADPDVKPAMLWTLRDRPTVRVPLSSLTPRPEELILAARARMAVAC